MSCLAAHLHYWYTSGDIYSSSEWSLSWYQREARACQKRIMLHSSRLLTQAWRRKLSTGRPAAEPELAAKLELGQSPALQDWGVVAQGYARHFSPNMRSGWGTFENVKDHKCIQASCDGLQAVCSELRMFSPKRWSACKASGSSICPSGSVKSLVRSLKPANSPASWLRIFSPACS